jgi:hypothetical protein
MNTREPADARERQVAWGKGEAGQRRRRSRSHSIAAELERERNSATACDLWRAGEQPAPPRRAEAHLARTGNRSTTAAVCSRSLAGPSQRSIPCCPEERKDKLYTEPHHLISEPGGRVHLPAKTRVSRLASGRARFSDRKTGENDRRLGESFFSFATAACKRQLCLSVNAAV